MIHAYRAHQRIHVAGLVATNCKVALIILLGIPQFDIHGTSIPVMTGLFPPWTVGLAICCAILILPLFALLQWVPLLQHSGRRLWASVFLATAVSATVMLVGHKMGLPVRGVDIATGAAIMLSAAICAFLVISLLAWGFTISIARDLGAAEKPVSLEEWKAAFANGLGFDAFARDRLALLVAMGVASANGGRLLLTARGRLISRLARVGMIYFAVDRARG